LATALISDTPSEGLLRSRAREIAAGLGRNHPILLRSSRAVLTRPLRRTMADDLHVGLALEAFASPFGAEWFTA
jgi:hypothetical protein